MADHASLKAVQGATLQLRAGDPQAQLVTLRVTGWGACFCAVQVTATGHAHLGTTIISNTVTEATRFEVLRVN